MRLWGAHVLGVLAVAIAVGMGVWQYDAYNARRAAEQRDLTGAAPVPFASVLGPDSPFPSKDVGRPVTLEGTWIGDATVFVDGRESDDGREGMWVVTPMNVGGASAPAVPVVRGWVPEGTTLAHLGAAPSGEGRVTGWVQPTEGTGQSDPDPTDDILPQLRTADLVQRVDVDLYGAYVVADAVAPADRAAGLDGATLDQLPPASRFTGLRNILYAIEWWVFAAFAAFIWWRYVRDALRDDDEDDEAEDDEGEDDEPAASAADDAVGSAT